MKSFNQVSGFSHSIKSSLLKLKNYILVDTCSGGCSVLVLLDLSAAFDTPIMTYSLRAVLESSFDS